MKYFWSWFYFGLMVLLLFLTSLWLMSKKGFFYREPHFPVTLFTQAEFPYLEANSDAELAVGFEELGNYIAADAYFVFDNSSKSVLVEKNPQLPLPPASTTKLMTVFTALQLYDLNEVAQVSTTAALENDGGGLFPLEKIKVKDLAAAALVRSANDAALTLAEHHNQGEVGFVAEMNRRAQELSLFSTRFANPVGYDDPDNISTAHDLAILTMRVIQEKPIAEWMSLRSYVAENENGTIRHFLFTTNELLGKEDGVVAGKTGTTPQAKEVLITIARINDHDLIIVVLGSSDRYQDTKTLLHWIRDNIKWRTQEFPLQIPVENR
ncbi:MAG: hypothetical protein COU63_02785 [Candidatus Pacebacteria bacterium CG10_big_fil_rev_8_21_14_0_10_36_11]|nr:D-alanyl-D-alanine carboxypeptidase [Candidatus Pacearchaeota archaeon]OIP74354.1 MAG: hypothetical protein AUK08_01040 [Candidatus Pacebacteria bacterium CG2_30_36_39]PIR64918.1 MAG: hypothetical protein COU63_02785 [Candidatus Pacebacteria bacterium CG10_big_fil_rev_8_21_14_0_10_36_11]PJC42810.1 MAG: hypothetical protein CO040_02485 [Candidatus Pacebacteria bacterium CG_4_9_14_0_2_um_filter_36_8]